MLGFVPNPRKAALEGRSPEEAFAELRRCAGTQFDPQLVERFISIVNVRRASSQNEVKATQKDTALQIGMQIEQLAQAVDQRDIDGLASSPFPPHPNPLSPTAMLEATYFFPRRRLSRDHGFLPMYPSRRRQKACENFR